MMYSMRIQLIQYLLTHSLHKNYADGTECNAQCNADVVGKLHDVHNSSRISTNQVVSENKSLVCVLHYYTISTLEVYVMSSYSGGDDYTSRSILGYAALAQAILESEKRYNDPINNEDYRENLMELASFLNKDRSRVARARVTKYNDRHSEY